jgi:hypothetical protein
LRSLPWGTLGGGAVGEALAEQQGEIVAHQATELTRAAERTVRGGAL